VGSIPSTGTTNVALDVEKLPPAPTCRVSGQEKVMNAHIEQIFEGLICLVSAAVVLGGTLAICFPATASVGA
jgi:hypothetical protein